ncbi:hypothetical protein [Alicyclobacillus sp. SO9]|uniref:hypothetical protein n=1 Tax=Alicyclobacillus sp. SO9 TaxID=2665646 RepID=UPI0018E7F4C3|nr:hypothetical protein [Alicyclobacillus sp. SO9]QQE77234.1 hypothetical protein GI364_14835 [Alicyclobacillus sp. SO9]
MIRIKRAVSLSDNLRNYHVVLDGTEIGSVGPGDTFEYSLNAGYHKIHLEIDWCRSNELEFEVKNDEVLDFKCGGLNGFKVLAVIWFITFGRNRYLWIKRMTPLFS